MKPRPFEGVGYTQGAPAASYGQALANDTAEVLLTHPGCAETCHPLLCRQQVLQAKPLKCHGSALLTSELGSAWEAAERISAGCGHGRRKHGRTSGLMFAPAARRRRGSERDRCHVMGENNSWECAGLGRSQSSPFIRNLLSQTPTAPVADRGETLMRKLILFVAIAFALTVGTVTVLTVQTVRRRGRRRLLQLLTSGSGPLRGSRAAGIARA